MCIQSFLPNTDRDKIVNGITRDGKKVYKVVRVIDGKYYPLFNRIDEPYNEGIMEADQEARGKTVWDWGSGAKEYKAGFHFWLHKKDAVFASENIIKNQKSGRVILQFKDVEIKVITCTIKKSWVNVLGRDETCEHEADAIVTKKAIFPKFRGKR